MRTRHLIASRQIDEIRAFPAAIVDICRQFSRQSLFQARRRRTSQKLTSWIVFSLNWPREESRLAESNLRMSDRDDPKGLLPRVNAAGRLRPRRKRSIGDSNQLASSMLLCLLAIASSDPPQDTQSKVKHRGPEPLRPGVLDLCEVW